MRLLAILILVLLAGCSCRQGIAECVSSCSVYTDTTDVQRCLDACAYSCGGPPKTDTMYPQGKRWGLGGSWGLGQSSGTPPPAPPPRARQRASTVAPGGEIQGNCDHA